MVWPMVDLNIQFVRGSFKLICNDHNKTSFCLDLGSVNLKSLGCAPLTGLRITQSTAQSQGTAEST